MTSPSNNNNYSCWSTIPGHQIDADVGLGVTTFFHSEQAKTSSRPAHVFNFSQLASGGDAAVHRQQDSSLFGRLPLEIRMMIYREVLPEDKRLWVRPAAQKSISDFELFPAEAGPVDLHFREELNEGHGRLTGRSFWKKAQLGQLGMHEDSMALMKSCRRAFLEMLPMWTLAFDRVDHLCSCADFLSWAQNESPVRLPVRSIEFVSHAKWGLYADHNPSTWETLPESISVKKMLRKKEEQEQWENHVDSLAQVCDRLPGITRLKLSVVASPQPWNIFANEQAVVDSLKKVKGVPDMRVELPRQQQPKPQRDDGECAADKVIDGVFTLDLASLS